MKPVYITVLQEETGKRIKELMKDRRLKVRDIQDACGFEQPQAIYKWLSGKSLPSIENMVILSVVLDTPIDGILVRSGDASFFCLPVIYPTRGVMKTALNIYNLSYVHGSNQHK